MKRLFLGLTVILSLVVVPKAFAASCQPIYGGGPTCTDSTFSIEKQVLNPQTNLFVHDLGLNDAKYHGNDLVTFQITLNNNGNDAIQQIVVNDILPKELQFSDGPGFYDPKTRTLSFIVKNLAPHHAQLFTVNTHVVSQDQFPANSFCITNQVSAFPSSGNLSQDSSEVCFGRITTTPSTGANPWTLVALFSFAVMSFGIQKFAKR